MPKTDYNLIAIGAGSGGLVSSFIGAAVKAKVALIEKHKMGGDCLNTGCVPSKALISSAKAVQMMKKHSLYGLKNVNYEVDFAQVMERVQDIIAKIEPHDSVERYSSLGVECHIGEATIRSPHEVEVNGKILTTKNIVVATGARPFIPPTPGLEDVSFSHSDNLWQLRKQPKHLAVIGGGPIGSELAQAFRRLGSEVTIFNMDRGILPREDSDMVQFICDSFNKDGINLLDEAQLPASKKSVRLHVFITPDTMKKSIWTLIIFWPQSDEFQTPPALGWKIWVWNLTKIKLSKSTSIYVPAFRTSSPAGMWQGLINSHTWPDTRLGMPPSTRCLLRSKNLLWIILSFPGAPTQIRNWQELDSARMKQKQRTFRMK